MNIQITNELLGFLLVITTFAGYYMVPKTFKLTRYLLMSLSILLPALTILCRFKSVTIYGIYPYSGIVVMMLMNFILRKGEI